MTEERPSAVFSVDGYEVSVSFSSTRNNAVINQVKQILLSSFVAHTSKAAT